MNVISVVLNLCSEYFLLQRILNQENEPKLNEYLMLVKTKNINGNNLGAVRKTN